MGAIIFYREVGPSVCGVGGPEFFGVVKGGGAVFFFSGPRGGGPKIFEG